jgi:Protein of unknown function (Hypoth_ymh)
MPRTELRPLTFTRPDRHIGGRGEYDTAVFQAFREVEVAVRSAGKFPAEQFGKELMRKAFKPADAKNPTIAPGPLAARRCRSLNSKAWRISSAAPLVCIRTLRAIGACRPKQLRPRKSSCSPFTRPLVGLSKKACRLDAMETRVFTFRGKVRDTLQVINFAERRAYIELVMEYGSYRRST